MLRHPHFESFAQVKPSAPGVLQPDRIHRPGIKSLRKILAKQKSRFSEQEEPPELSAPKGMRFHISGDHVAREGVARIVDTSGNSRVRPANIRINLVMRRRQVKLSVSP